MSRLFHVYYAKPGVDSLVDTITITSVMSYATHLLVAEILAENLEQVFEDMQGENWSPNGEKQEFIKRLDLTHTSMSVDDAVFDLENHKLYLCDDFGWTEL